MMQSNDLGSDLKRFRPEMREVKRVVEWPFKRADALFHQEMMKAILVTMAVKWREVDRFGRYTHLELITFY